MLYIAGQRNLLSTYIICTFKTNPPVARNIITVFNESLDKINFNWTILLEVFFKLPIHF